MTKRVKRVLFYTALAVFLFLSFFIILYAQGYKYNFTDNKFSRTGAIALKVNTGARVYLDNKLQGDTSFFNNTFSVDRLLPGEYRLSVQKDDYSAWQKWVTVEEGLVADYSQIMILPEEGDEEQDLFEEVELLFEELEPIPTLLPTVKNIDKEVSSSSSDNNTSSIFILDVGSKKLIRNEGLEPITIANEVKGFRISENKNKIAWWTTNELWVMWLNSQDYQPFHLKNDKELITRFQTTIQDGSWFRGEDHLILELEQLDSRSRPYSIYKIIEIDKRGGLNIVEL